ncbi:tRNA (adenosine(37)-N6)-dimethylallyltransferase MiaA [Candidatus Anaplasma sp. TIGMIC]|uniref:tRNA (adenosine(37)-N6)-dimethylallyltransferase MiaA n=1 Tax=Candidatus Anaplasma sp. TIGMIC TaxID=3020713 RepID=UPI00232FACE8|nr:tRNA (adenosine(37)-N6)-dimethylallyltransferase MiaA [Candidatus Anaplasma sp. TIGMIC]MDB1135150.1 tRNA (adenosine(37)-N6)-dimethylallyltransferase MiaA [Candidatus Anaplasma sp. TIGMIC]
MREREVVVLTGPTASGKSEICDSLLKSINCRIINCDSKQIYSGIPTISAQPLTSSNKELYRLYGYVHPAENYSVNLWLEDAKREIHQAWEENIIPIVTGGSGLYISSLVYGLSPIPEIDPDIRHRSRSLLSELGNDEFYSMLTKIDAQASRIDKNNSYRMLRAFEVALQTGKSIFTLYKCYPKIQPFKNYKVFVLLPDREQLYHKINERFLDMINSSAIEEVKYLMSLDITGDSPVMKTLGVPEISRYLLGNIDLADTVAEAQKNTRHYAKRQYTWFRTQLPEGSLFFTSKSELEQHMLSYLHKR